MLYMQACLQYGAAGNRAKLILTARYGKIISEQI
jgi:hypothetical protein